jgi:tRNA dimethylallyltransferase
MSLCAFFLVGPTATGKTAVAQWIAEHHGYEILSADSMLVYRGMDIGTAKPTPHERRNVRYWGVDLVPATAPFSVGRYVEEARRCLGSARERNIPVIVTGGTGLYIKALLAGLDEGPVASDNTRKRLHELLDREGVAGLQRELEARNPDWYGALPDKNNSRRLLRALELIDAGWSAPPRSWREAGSLPELPGLSRPRHSLQARIAERVTDMYARGLLAETQQLIAGGMKEAPTASHAVGYAEATALLEGKLTLDAAIEKTIQRTRQLAKRQMTWFRHQVPVKWVDVTPEASVEDVAARVMGFWTEHGPTPVAIDL